MNKKLMQMLKERIATGLKKKSIQRCSDWATMFRVMGEPIPGPWSFKYHPWVKQMHDDTNSNIVGRKAAQMGFTEVALNKTFYNIDYKGITVMYFLPASKPDATDFSTGRFDPALEMSKHLRNLFSDVSNIGHKRAGNANLYIRGARSRSQAKSVPCGMMIFDELDEMNPDIINLALERMSGHKNKQNFKLSTPTIDKKGIEAEFQLSDQKHFFFKCPHCSKLTELTWPDSLVITAENPLDTNILDSHLICKECHATLSHDTKHEWLADGIWVPAKPKRLISGYHINQLYSSTMAPYEIATVYLKSLSNAAVEQEFYNSKLGLPHTLEGARVTETDLENCIKKYKQHELASSGGLITMGVDVGKWLHYVISRWKFPDSANKVSTTDINIMAHQQIIKVGKVKDFEALDALLNQFYVRFCIIDAQPEARKALEFVRRNPGRVKVCYYGKGLKTKQTKESDETVVVDRTSWLDMSLGRYRNNTISLPIDIGLEFKDHIKALVRIYEKDKTGNSVGKYVKGDNDMDHFAHAQNYSEIALPICVSFAQNRNISGVY